MGRGSRGGFYLVRVIRFFGRGGIWVGFEGLEREVGDIILFDFSV